MDTTKPGAIYKQLGPYNLKEDDLKINNTPSGIKLGPYKIKRNNAVYLGEWFNGYRHGKGLQIWVDGSIYEGKQ